MFVYWHNLLNHLFHVSVKLLTTVHLSEVNYNKKGEFARAVSLYFTIYLCYIFNDAVCTHNIKQVCAYLRSW
jgi:hypothetical protein